jgi:hypothetical protein
MIRGSRGGLSASRSIFDCFDGAGAFIASDMDSGMHGGRQERGNPLRYEEESLFRHLEEV